MSVLTIDHIASDPDKHNGKPRIAGKGITVQHIAALHNHGWTVGDLVEEYELTPGQVHAALSYYFDHKDEIDQAIQEAHQKAQSVGISATELRRRIEARQTNRRPE
jgi:uncharacterized protein (DUF433 family)